MTACPGATRQRHSGRALKLHTDGSVCTPVCETHMNVYAHTHSPTNTHHTHIHTHAHTHLYAHTPTRMHTHTFMHTHMHTSIPAHLCTQTHTPARSPAQTLEQRRDHNTQQAEHAASRTRWAASRAAARSARPVLHVRGIAIQGSLWWHWTWTRCPLYRLRTGSTPLCACGHRAGESPGHTQSQHPRPPPQQQGQGGGSGQHWPHAQGPVRMPRSPRARSAMTPGPRPSPSP